MEKDGYFQLDSTLLSAHSVQHSHALASLYFFNKTTTNFHFLYGMIGPKLFDLAAIAGLAPTYSLVDPSYFPDN